MEPLDPNLVRRNRPHTGRITGITPASSPRHLGSALPGSAVPDKGLPQAERSSPLAGAVEAGSHLAGDEEGVPSPRSQPARRGQLLTWALTFGSYLGVIALGFGIVMFTPMNPHLAGLINFFVLILAVIAAVKTHESWKER